MEGSKSPTVAGAPPKPEAADVEAAVTPVPPTTPSSRGEGGAGVGPRSSSTPAAGAGAAVVVPTTPLPVEAVPTGLDDAKKSELLDEWK